MRWESSRHNSRCVRNEDNEHALNPLKIFGASRRLRRCMVSLGWQPIRQLGVNARGYREQVRAYARLPNITENVASGDDDQQLAAGA